MADDGTPYLLPNHLQERCRWVVEPNQNKPSFVLYWMRTAVRTDENPALDTALTLAAQLQIPILIYHGLSQRYPYASDRHHAFIMQGARDVQRSCKARDIPYAFHLERPNHAPHCLRDLAEASRLVITEDMPTRPASTFLDALAKRATFSILAVDTACLHPMRMHGRAYTRAYAYREATWNEYQRRLLQPWPTCEVTPPAGRLPSLPFTSLDLSSHDFDDEVAEWIGQCDIDHTVAPVLDTRGGSVAGYERWRAFCDKKLRRYDKQRNDPLTDGVSRMSAYLHYGMVAPTRLACEASTIGGSGADKFLDELLIWRELAYTFCFYRTDHERWSALPEWAQRTLDEHAGDPRPNLYTWEQLARGVTSDPLWNAAQHSLLLHGELHNNVRMTWGKAILQWRSNPKEALALMIDLNHRYALDGRDPASYGGLLWCLGQFDRPFEPEQPIYGTVRTRSTEEHARRLNVAQYARLTSTTRSSSPPNIALLGHGIAIAIAARTLADHGLAVTVFPNSAVVAEDDPPPTVNSSKASGTAWYRCMASWVEQGILSLDEVPNGAKIESHLLDDRVSQNRERVFRLRRGEDGVELFDVDGERIGLYDRVVALEDSKVNLADEKQGAAAHSSPWDQAFASSFARGCAVAGRILRGLPGSTIAPKQGLLF